MIRSWYPEVKLEYVKNEYFPETTDEEGHRLIAHSLEVVEQMVSKVNVHPQHKPVAQASGPMTGEEETDPDLLELDDPKDPESPKAGASSKHISTACHTPN